MVTRLRAEEKPRCEAGLEFGLGAFQPRLFLESLEVPERGDEELSQAGGFWAPKKAVLYKEHP